MSLSTTHALPRILLALPLAVASLPFALPAMAQEAGARHEMRATKPATISVTGRGEAYAAPDMALIRVGVATEATDAAGAMAENNGKQAAIIEALKSAGIEGRDMQTSDLSLDQRIAYPEKEAPRIEGYRASNMLTVRVRDLEKLGEILDATIKAGATNLVDLNFQRDDNKSLQDEARKAAVEDAVSRATIMAEAAGVKLGAIRMIDEGSAQMPPRPMAMMARAGMADMESSVPVQAGEMVISTDVRVVFELIQ